jgi:hypothetical protein
VNKGQPWLVKGTKDVACYQIKYVTMEGMSNVSPSSEGRICKCVLKDVRDIKIETDVCVHGVMKSFD